ncbi:hypothetical protein [Actinomadura craniellae]|uniref:hypothetical protein n=1 Tax=Actinomadura craniellae TaxID=2231787 RepID=UPI001313F729|nr:hypothetical protein [Actinomadura craniellae]
MRYGSLAEGGSRAAAELTTAHLLLVALSAALIFVGVLLVRYSSRRDYNPRHSDRRGLS